MFEYASIFFLFLSVTFSMFTVAIYRFYKKRLRIFGGWYTYTQPFFVLQLFLLTYLGIYIAFFMKSLFPRLSYISYESIAVFMLAISYSVFIILLAFIFYFELTKGKVTSFRQKYTIRELFLCSAKTLSVNQLFFILFIIFCYVFYKYYFFYSISPFFYLISGEPIMAAQSRYLIQTGALSVDVKYLSKVVEILGFYSVIYTFILYKIFGRKIYIYLFLGFISLVCFNLVFDAQKAPLIIIVSCLFFVSIAIENKLKYFLYFSLLISFLLILISYLSSDTDGFNFNIIISIVDRVLIGQNQGMYYIYDYLNVNYYDIFSWLANDGFEPADRLVVKFMDFYRGNPNIVNVNTYFIGEAWYSMGWVGLVISPFIVSFVFLLFLLIFDYLLCRNYLLYFPLAIYTASIIPISRSFYQIISFKFMFYVVIFGVIPIAIISMLKVRGKVFSITSDK
ncbi:hypothetical protein ACE02B_06615 [Shewanella mangrovisoli]|uniref:hypothetical protein n=1 Tax=Shewanella mangrovisoli TaxID=2864211 RepID=UPI0035B80D83